MRECDWVHRLARALVADPGAAADAAQDTLLLALRRTPRAGAPLRPWLAGVLGNLLRQGRRGAGRRASREAQHSVERSERDEDPALRLERLELHRHVIELVQALDEPYRATVVMRFLEDRAPNEIARSTGVPVKTVYTRLERALAQLRTQLDRREGERGIDRQYGWALALLPASFTSPAAVPTTAAMARGLSTICIIMSTTQRSFLAIALLLAAGLGLRAALNSEARETPALTRTGGSDTLAASMERDAAAAAEERSRAPVEQGRGASSVPTEQSSTEPTAVVTTAKVDVVVRRKDTGAPLTSYGVKVFPSSMANPFLHSEAKLTDAAGRVRFEVHAPVRCGIYASTGGGDVVDLEAGETRVVEVVVADVRSVQGLVVGPDGGPIAGASVWVSDYANYTKGLVVGQTASDGRFEVTVGSQNYVGARMAGQLASHLELVLDDVSEVRLVLRGPAGRVQGIVRDSLGAPVSGAIVQLGIERNSLPPGPDGKTITGAPGARVYSDAEGRFRFDECEPGRQPLVVRAEGFAMDRRMVVAVLPVEGAPAEEAFANVPEQEVVLERGVTIEGWVTDGGGQPLADASVAFGQYGQLESGRATSDSSGRYTLDSAPIGPLELKATLRDVGVARTTVEGRPGETLTWSPVLSSGPVIAGIVIDERSAPRAGVVVEAITLAAGIAPSRNSVTDEAGRFRFSDLPRANHDLHISAREQRQTIHVEEEVEPDGPPLTIVVTDALLATATISGSITGHDGAALEPRLPLLAFSMLDPGRGLQISLDGGRFTGGPWAAGEYELRTNSRTYPQTCLARFTLAAGEQRDLGALRLQPLATLVVEAVPAAGAPTFEPNEVSVRARGNGTLEGSWRSLFLRERGQDSVAVVPGRYKLVATDRRSVASVTTVVLAPGEVVHVQLDMQPATQLELAITGAREGGRDPVEFEVRDEHGALLLREGVSPHMPLLPAGVYHVRAIQGRRVGAVSVVTLPREAGAAPLALRL